MSLPRNQLSAMGRFLRIRRLLVPKAYRIKRLAVGCSPSDPQECLESRTQSLTTLEISFRLSICSNLTDYKSIIRGGLLTADTTPIFYQSPSLEILRDFPTLDGGLPKSIGGSESTEIGTQHTTNS